MPTRWSRSSSVVVATLFAGILAAAPLARAAGPLTFEKYRAKAEKLAPPFPTVPGKTFCVCQTNDPNTAYLGYLNSFIKDDLGDQTVNLICAYPVFTPGVGVATCAPFEVIK